MELSAPYGSANGPALGKDGTLVIAGKGTELKAFVGSEPIGLFDSKISVPVLTASPNPATEIMTFTIDANGPGDNNLQIFDVNGKLIRQLTSADFNSHTIEWDLRDSDGHCVPTGVYICRYASTSLAGVVKCIVSK